MQIRALTQEGDQWQIWVQPLTGIETPQFKQFTESLNDYLFSILKLTPNLQDAGLPRLLIYSPIIYPCKFQQKVCQVHRAPVTDIV
jgi:hypothetical protein